MLKIFSLVFVLVPQWTHWQGLPERPSDDGPKLPALEAPLEVDPQVKTAPGVAQVLGERECLEWWAPPACPPAMLTPHVSPDRTAAPPAATTEVPTPQSIAQPFQPESMPASPSTAMAFSPAPATSLSAGQGTISGFRTVAMMTGDLFGTGTSKFTVSPGAYTARGPVTSQSYFLFRDIDSNNVFNHNIDTGLPVATDPGTNGGMTLHASGSPTFPTPKDFETVLSRTQVNTQFQGGTLQFQLRNEPSLTTDLNASLNGRPEFAAGQSYGGGVIAAGGPDFQSTLTSLVADYDTGPGPIDPARAPGVGLDPLNDTFFVNAAFDSAPLVEFNPTPTVMTALPGGTLASAPGDNVGRIKLAENTSPIPRDRVYVNYSYFDSASITPRGASVNRVTPGFEKTFLDGNASFEFRAPFATTLDSTIFSGGTTNTNSAEFGNLSMYLKTLLWSNDSFGVSAGCGVSAPTSNDFRVRDAATRNIILAVDNESPHVLPFVGAIYAPDERLFAQSLLQFDFDTIGNPVSLSSYDQGLPTGDLSRIGRAQDASYMFLGGNVGYWIYQGTTPSLPFTGLSPFAEVYYNQSLSRGDRIQGDVSGAQFDSGRPGSLQLVNGVVGMNATMHFGGMLTVAYATPLGGGKDQQYDGEIRVLYNVFFGPQNRFTRAQF